MFLLVLFISVYFTQTFPSQNKSMINMVRTTNLREIDFSVNIFHSRLIKKLFSVTLKQTDFHTLAATMLRPIPFCFFSVTVIISGSFLKGWAYQTGKGNEEKRQEFIFTARLGRVPHATVHLQSKLQQSKNISKGN